MRFACREVLVVTHFFVRFLFASDEVAIEDHSDRFDIISVSRYQEPFESLCERADALRIDGTDGFRRLHSRSPSRSDATGYLLVTPKIHEIEELYSFPSVEVSAAIAVAQKFLAGKPSLGQELVRRSTPLPSLHRTAANLPFSARQTASGARCLDYSPAAVHGGIRLPVSVCRLSRHDPSSLD